MLVSGIGCSSRFPYFVKTYGMHTAHGRSLPVAAGMKVARPDQEVIAFGGDGDGFSIGGGHVPHIARKNTDMTYIVMDNSIYGLTKGQMSPTTQVGMPTSITPYGAPDNPINPLTFTLAYGATFVAQAYSSQGKVMQEIIKKAIQHRGFSFVNVVSPCPTFNKLDTFDSYKGNIDAVPDDHDTSNIDAALALANKARMNLVGKTMTGIFYQEDRPTLLDRLGEIQTKVNATEDYDINKIIDLYQP